MVLIGALPSEVNVSYVDYEDSIVATVDGQKVASLSHLPFLFSRAVVASASCRRCSTACHCPSSRRRQLRHLAPCWDLTNLPETCK